MGRLIGTPPAGQGPGPAERWRRPAACRRGRTRRSPSSTSPGRHSPGGGQQPVRQLTGANERNRVDELAGEQAVGGGRSEQPQQGVHGARGERSPALARALQQSLTWHQLGLTGKAVTTACAFSQLGAECHCPIPSHPLHRTLLCCVCPASTPLAPGQLHCRRTAVLVRHDWPEFWSDWCPSPGATSR